jgi:hypothetical protein
VIETRVFDHTSIVALFQGNDQAFRVWQAAEADKLTLILPAVAVAEAYTTIGADSNAWRAILDPGRVVVTPLDESTAIDLGRTVGSLVIRHVVREASQTQGEIVTAAPWQYPADTPPIWTL